MLPSSFGSDGDDRGIDNAERSASESDESGRKDGTILATSQTTGATPLLL